MTATIIYTLMALLVFILATLLVRQRHETPAGEAAEAVRDVGAELFLRLSERIFDPADYLWLRDKAGFPELARVLARSRQQMALRWLKALRRSFDDLVRTPEPLGSEENASDAPGTWGLLGLTLRFQLLLGYALLVVWLFGPYHRLVPMLNWRRVFPEPSRRKERFGTVDIRNLP